MIGGFMQRIDECNEGLGEVAQLTPFIIDGKRVGAFLPSSVPLLLRFPKVFNVSGAGRQGSVTLAPHLEGRFARTEAVAEVLRVLRDEGVITGWRDELYPVTPSFYEEPVMLIERAAAPFFGIKAYGVHINGYVRNGDGSLSLWIARRSKDKPTWPGKLDHLAAGGQPHGLSIMGNVAKECSEEASVPEALARTARPVGAICYTTVSDKGLKPDVIFCFDLELPPDFVPTPQDGEVDEFMLWPLDKVAKTIATTTEFKTNVNLVIIDFLIRHGYVSPDQPGYLDVLKGLRRGELL